MQSRPAAPSATVTALTACSNTGGLDRMSEGRTTQQRKADVLAALARNGDLWLATASADGQPHLIAASAWWDGSQLTVATTAGSRTARNLEASKSARIGVGATD